jgi:tetratricopeptide (TPR) repeat protein
MQSKAKPEELADADWQKKKQTLLAFGFWMQGAAYNTQAHYADADKALRQALPLVKNDNRLMPMVLFQLGVADFQLGKSSKNTAMIKEALNFSKQSAAVSSPVQVEAQNNVKAITKALGIGAH